MQLIKSMAVVAAAAAVTPTDAEPIAGFAVLVDEPVSDVEATACWKKFDFRGLGHLPDCGEDEEKEMGICYKKCADSSEGFGPLCMSDCPKDFPVSAGAICCADENTCHSDLVDIAVRIPLDIAKAVRDESNPMELINDLKHIFHDAAKLAFKECV